VLNEQTALNHKFHADRAKDLTVPKSPINFLLKIKIPSD
jgi:hypothetical protein